MAAANGFTATTPDTRFGDTTATCTNGMVRVQKFTAPGSGTLEISEIGAYVSDTDGVFKMAILLDDDDHSCPSATMVANSETPEMEPGFASIAKAAHTYDTKPEVTGGTVYWLGLYTGPGAQDISLLASGGTSGYVSASYSTWPTDTAWHSINALSGDYSLYAVYGTPEAGTTLPPHLLRTTNICFLSA